MGVEVAALSCTWKLCVPRKQPWELRVLRVMAA
jgi:hypothetical protein